MEKKSELTPRQWVLYEFLKSQNDWVKQEHISSSLPDLYGTDETPFHDTIARINITNDIRAIKKSEVIQKIVISNAKGVKIANVEEFDEWFKRKAISLKKQMGLLYKQLKKAQLNNQTRIVYNSERDFIEAFKEEVKE
jgi:hypothetical protein